jgi:hypothetical protein
VRIRNFGFLASRRRRSLLPLCFRCLGSKPDTSNTETQPAAITGLWKCPRCGGPMVVTLRVQPPLRLIRSPPQSLVVSQGI